VPGEPPAALHASALDLMWHFTTAGQETVGLHAVVPSGQTPFTQVPAVAKQQVAKPGFPQVERAAQRVTAPWQFLGSAPLFIAWCSW